MKAVIKFIFQTIAVVIIAIGGFTIYLIQQSEPEPKPEMSQADTDAGIMRLVCKDTINANLHDPSSAEWGFRDDGWFQTWPVSDDGENLSVTAKFRAKNKLGALVVAEYTCTAKRVDGELQFMGIKAL